jgi:hypothetical protein
MNSHHVKPVASPQAKWGPREAYFALAWKTALTGTPVPPEATRVRALPALMRHSQPICSVRFTEPCKALLASPFRPRLGVRRGWSPFPKDSSHGQTTR